jgi:nitrogen regulatory protein PII
MKLLVIVLNAIEMLEEVLEGLIETGISGATVVDSEGMGHIIEEVPLFAGMRNLFRSARPRNKIIFSVITNAQAREGLEVLEKILGCSHQKGRGIAFVLPIEAVIGTGKQG